MFLKKITLTVFSFLIIFPALAKVTIILDFKIKQEYLRANKCIKKEKLENDCNAHCFLKKKLKKTEGGKSQKTPLPNSLNEKFESFSSIDCFQYIFFSKNHFMSKVNLFKDYCTLYNNPFLSGSFKPPQSFLA